MKKQFLEIGKIINTHGVRGELKVEPWCDSPEFLISFNRVFINEKEVKVLSARAHKHQVLMMLEGVTDVTAAMKLKEKVLFIDRSDIDLEDGRVFVQDIIGLPVFDLRQNREIGTLEGVDNLPAQDVYVIKNGDKRHMIPAIPPFLVEIEKDERIVVRTIGGMADED